MNQGACNSLICKEILTCVQWNADNPCPKKPKPVDSSRFLNHIDQLDAIQRGVEIMNKNGTNSAIFDMGRTVGEGFKANSCVKVTTSRVVVVRSGNGSIITAYPKL
jgi:hypothetical protein